MVQGPSPELVEAICKPVSKQAHIASLRQLKNDIIGHDQRKELLVRRGLVQPLVDILPSRVSHDGRNKLGDGGAPAMQSPQSSEDTEVRLQATLILGSVAGAGLAFVAPLLAAGLPQRLINVLHLDESRPLTIAALQTFRNLAASWSSGTDIVHGRNHGVFTLFENAASQAPFARILRQPCRDTTERRRLQLAIEIIALCACDESTRSAFTSHGILDALVSLLCSNAVKNDHFRYRGYHHATATKFLPSPPDEVVPTILAAITAIVDGSGFRTLHFILSQAIQDLFIYSIPLDSRDPAYPHLVGPQATVEPLLPPLRLPAQKSVSFSSISGAFPALSNLQPVDGRLEPVASQKLRGWYADHAVAVCSWLLHLARSLSGTGRLTALRLLALVNDDIDTDTPPKNEDIRKQHRERQVALLAIPLVVSLVDSAPTERASATEAIEHQHVKEQACEVLALLVRSSKDLQAAAVDAGAIKRVCPIFKKTFDSVAVAKPLWSARAASSLDLNDPSIPESCRLGPRGLPPEIIHIMRCRRSALEALAALAGKEDIYRKAVVDAGVVSTIIDSLKPLSVDLSSSSANEIWQISPKDGNVTSVIVAACHAAQSMSRSVSMLRTSLIDAGIALPLFALLKHRDLQVQIAATDVCCNLVLEFSPMREDLLKAGVIKTLTEHARQSDTELRLSALWALKHLVLHAPRDIKLRCLEELGTTWLVNIIQGEQRDLGTILNAYGGVSIGLSTPNAAGEQVDLLNPSSMDVDDPPIVENDRDLAANNDEDEDGEILYDEQSSTHYQASQLRSTLQKQRVPTFNSKKYLSSIRDLETNLALQAKRSEVAVQEQALDFIRNFLNDDNAALQDHLFQQIGSQKFFSLLTEKLSPLPNTSRHAVSSSSAATGSNAQQLPTSQNWQIYQPTELILATIHVLTHLANGTPKHKSLLLSQRQLMTNWLPHFAHPHRMVRVMSVWTVNSLTWIEDDKDRAPARQRCHELRSLGIEAAVRALANDLDLDVRERVKTALRQFEGI